MTKSDYLKEIEEVEDTFSKILNTRKHYDIDRFIAKHIISDAVNLLKDIIKDRYMFELSNNNCENESLFAPRYYYENFLFHNDMIWKRILVIIGIAYQIDFQEIFDKKEIDDLYVIIKKNDQVNSDIKKLLQEIEKEKIFIIHKSQKKYAELLKICVVQADKAFNESSFTFKQKKYFWCDYDHSKYLCNNIRPIYKDLEKTYDALQEEGIYLRNDLLIDALFRAKEIIKTIKKYIYNDILFSSSYYDYAILKLYSACEKVADFLICKYDFGKEYLDDRKINCMYINKIKKLIESKELNSPIIKKFYDCVSSKEYEMYEKFRNRDYNCIRSVYMVNGKTRDIIMAGCICIMAKIMDDFSKLFFMIINEEKNNMQR
ncbi:MAG: hypothetical protein ACTTKD_06340 [Peptoanaerobacter stomatis]|uniref:hypothetical protein n=1 Tax=Peptoanaerobacter stomatis TaxID=796937 RepID=UPI003F9F0626